MKLEEPTEEMKKSFYKNHKWSTIIGIFIYGIIAIVATGMFAFILLGCILGYKLSIIDLIPIGVVGLSGLSAILSVISSISTLVKMKKGEFMVSKVIFKATHKKLHSPLMMEIEYETEEGIMVTKKYEADIKGRKPVRGEEIFVTIMPDKVMYVVK